LKKVDFPTFGKPTIPILREVPSRPKRSGGFSTSFFFLGGMLTSQIKPKFRKIKFRLKHKLFRQQPIRSTSCSQQKPIKQSKNKTQEFEDMWMLDIMW